jgi:hypothetical protein
MITPDTLECTWIEINYRSDITVQRKVFTWKLCTTPIFSESVTEIRIKICWFVYELLLFNFVTLIYIHILYITRNFKGICNVFRELTALFCPNIDFRLKQAILNYTKIRSEKVLVFIGARGSECHADGRTQ